MKSSATHPGTGLRWQNRRKTRGTPVGEATVLLNYERLLFAERVKGEERFSLLFSIH
jgi:hypothetical protein